VASPVALPKVETGQSVHGLAALVATSDAAAE